MSSKPKTGRKKPKGLKGLSPNKSKDGSKKVHGAIRQGILELPLFTTLSIHGLDKPVLSYKPTDRHHKRADSAPVTRCATPNHVSQLPRIL